MHAAHLCSTPLPLTDGVIAISVCHKYFCEWLPFPFSSPLQLHLLSWRSPSRRRRKEGHTSLSNSGCGMTAMDISNSTTATSITLSQRSPTYVLSAQRIVAIQWANYNGSGRRRERRRKRRGYVDDPLAVYAIEQTCPHGYIIRVRLIAMCSHLFLVISVKQE